MGYKEGEVIQHSMITKSIERAQKKVEENAFGVRKRLLEYDDVMNAQRNAIYKKRRNALYGDRLELDISNMFYDVAEEIVNEHFPSRNFDAYEFDLVRYLKISSPVERGEFESTNPGELIDRIFDEAMTAYEQKADRLNAMALPVIEKVLENEGDRYKNMMLPVSDGSKSLRVIVNLEEGKETGGKIFKKQIEKMITLGFIDNEWKEHLRQMDDLRQTVQHASIEQKDPLVIYKKESFTLFQSMMGKMSKEVISFLAKSDLPQQAPEQQQATKESEFSNSGGAFKNAQIQQREQEFKGSEGYEQARENAGQPRQAPKRKPVVHAQPKIGRNEKVEIRNMQTGETKTLKYKQAENLLKNGAWQITKKA
jgi:preprotein translocase subunit SecA